MQRWQLISAASKKTRLHREKKMLEEMERAGGRAEGAGDHAVIWFDEKIFTVQAVTNTHNDRVYAANPCDLPEDNWMHIGLQKPACVMMWATMTSDGTKSPLAFIDEGVKVNNGV